MVFFYLGDITNLGWELTLGSTYRFIQDPSEGSAVLDWFKDLKVEKDILERSHENAVLIHFKAFGPLVMQSQSNTPDPNKSPIVSIFLPKIARGTIWTVGEVHFLATPLKELYPALHKISSDFRKWISTHDCIFSNKPVNVWPYSYYLGGDIMNYDSPVFSFPSGIEALSRGQFFISSDLCGIESLCQRMNLLGIECN